MTTSAVVLRNCLNRSDSARLRHAICFGSAMSNILGEDNGRHHALHQGTEMLLNREMQRALLSDLADVYPSALYGDPFRAWTQQPGWIRAVCYLKEHGLITAKVGETDDEFYALDVRATARGLDFLANDGGLTAILGVQTIRLHDDTIKSVIEAKILASDLPQPEKKRYLDQLRELPAESTKHILLKVLDLGFENGPQAIAWLGKWLQSLS